MTKKTKTKTKTKPNELGRFTLDVVVSKNMKDGIYVAKISGSGVEAASGSDCSVMYAIDRALRKWTQDAKDLTDKATVVAAADATVKVLCGGK